MFAGPQPLLIIRRTLREQIVILHRRLLAIVRDDEVCRRLMTTRGVGSVVALTLGSAILALSEPASNSVVSMSAKTLNDVSVSPTGADAAGAIVVLLSVGALRMVQKRTAEMRLIAGVDGCRCHPRGAEHMRVDRNA